MPKRIVIVQGHPDPAPNRFGRALASAYAEGARKARHEVKTIEVAQLDFPFLKTQEDFEHGTPPAPIKQAQDVIAWSEHLVLFFPLWIGTMPALLKAFIEQVFRPDFAMEKPARNQWPRGALRGKTARVVVTMGMPAPLYRLYFRAHGVRGLESSMRFCGFGRIRTSLIGMIDAPKDSGRKSWLQRMQRLGAEAK